ncbi:MAG TPA: RNA polymerase sigma factor [Anaerolineales bacterium]|nr:RNA polymerase sigma factor [Anaerolineales bacterium]
MALFSDEQLALGIQRGNTDDLTMLVERHHASLLGFLYRLTGGDRALAEDLVQETFLRLLGKIDSYRYPRPLKPWLYAIAVNLARDHYKQAEYRRTDSLPAQFEISMDRTPETELVAGDERQQVVSALKDLPALQREVIILRFLQDLSLNEISQTLRVPVGTVKSRLSLGLQRLKERVRAKK